MCLSLVPFLSTDWCFANLFQLREQLSQGHWSDKQKLKRFPKVQEIFTGKSLKSIKIYKPPFLCFDESGNILFDEWAGLRTLKGYICIVFDQLIFEKKEIYVSDIPC